MVCSFNQGEFEGGASFKVGDKEYSGDVGNESNNDVNIRRPGGSRVVGRTRRSAPTKSLTLGRNCPNVSSFRRMPESRTEESEDAAVFHFLSGQAGFTGIIFSLVNATF